MTYLKGNINSLYGSEILFSRKVIISLHNNLLYKPGNFELKCTIYM